MIDPATIDLARFLTTWYGPPEKAATSLSDAHRWLPEPLQQWYELTSQWHSRLTFTTKILPPEKVRISDDGKAVFMIDATGDWRWSFDPTAPESVFDAELFEPWERTPEKLSVFLVHNAAKQVVFGARARMRTVALPDERLEQILSSVDEVGFGTWNWPAPGYRIFMSDAVLLEIAPSEPEPGWDVDIAAVAPDHLVGFELQGVQWRKKPA